MTRFAASTAKSSEANSTGAPARSAPVAVERTFTTWRLGAVARGPRRAFLVARRVDTEHREVWRVDLSDSASPSEAVLLALTDALGRLEERGAQVVTVLVTDKTLWGYLQRGWRPGSLRMHLALRRFLLAVGGLTLEFEHAPFFERGSAEKGRSQRLQHR